MYFAGCSIFGMVAVISAARRPRSLAVSRNSLFVGAYSGIIKQLITCTQVGTTLILNFLPFFPSLEDKAREGALSRDVLALLGFRLLAILGLNITLDGNSSSSEVG